MQEPHPTSTKTTLAYFETAHERQSMTHIEAHRNRFQTIPRVCFLRKFNPIWAMTEKKKKKKIWKWLRSLVIDRMISRNISSHCNINAIKSTPGGRKNYKNQLKNLFENKRLYFGAQTSEHGFFICARSGSQRSLDRFYRFDWFSRYSFSLNRL